MVGTVDGPGCRTEGRAVSGKHQRPHDNHGNSMTPHRLPKPALILQLYKGAKPFNKRQWL